MTAGAATVGDVADVITFSSVDGPGNRFVVFFQGCNFDCVACHNPHTIPHATSDRFATDVGALMTQIRRAAPFVRGITVSGGEATQQPDFLRALLTAVKADPATAHLSCLVDTNGACSPAIWDSLATVMDGAMVDLKCLDPDTHRQMTGQPNDEVLASIRHLHAIGRLFEVRLLLVAGANDDDELLRRTATWLADVDPAMRVKLIAFRDHGARPHDPPLRSPGPDGLGRAAEVIAGVAPFEITTT